MAGRLPMTLKAASATIRASYRQGIRLYAAYQEKGDAGLIHGNCGKKSNHRLAEEVREVALTAYRERYSDFGPTFAAEKLTEEEGIKISVGTMRKLLIEAGEWTEKMRRKEYRREHRVHFGELVQFDGSRYA